MKKTGITLGKFAPFHRGHQLVIETALSEVEELYVMVYHTDATVNWIDVFTRNLYKDEVVLIE